MGLDQVQRCAIHPAIGIARAGNSPEEYFTGPEVPGVLPVAGDRYRDPQGRLKRQAARFRIYGYDASGNVVKEITSDEAEIEWTVHLANKKGAWYCIKFAMDIPDAVPVPRRNPSYAGDRADLIIDPGPRSVSGCEAVARFDGGRFLGTEVPLGEIRTDSKGRLLVFGGLGRSASVSGKPIASFDNEEWYDDNSDGPVTARVAIDGRSVEVTPAWVIVGPPDYAPGIRSVLTLYDLLYQVAVDKEWLTPPVRPSFARHIYPLFEAFSNLQWVNAGFYLEYGWGSPDYLLDPENLERLADKSEKNREARQSLFRRFRSPGFEKEEPDGLPPLYGDAMNLPVPPGNPRKWLAITPVQYGWLKQWAEGDFEADFESRKSPAPQKLEDIPLIEQPHALDEAALEHCQGGSFHPGCEAPWAMRVPLIYSAPFRIKHRPASEPERDYGDQLLPETALADDGPLNGSGPGDITRWMALPWQVDAGACGSGVEPEKNLYLPTFWPARIPNHVLTERSYRIVVDQTLDIKQRFKYFSLRQDWFRDFTPLQSYLMRVARFVDEWTRVGIIVRKRLENGHPYFPEEIYIEQENLFEADPDQGEG